MEPEPEPEAAEAELDAAAELAELDAAELAEEELLEAYDTSSNLMGSYQALTSTTS